MKDGQVVDDDPVYLVLKHEGAVLTGTAGPNAERQFPIAKGKAATSSAGTTITFEVTAGALVINFELKLVSGELKGSAVRRQGRRKTDRHGFAPGSQITGQSQKLPCPIV